MARWVSPIFFPFCLFLALMVLMPTSVEASVLSSGQDFENLVAADLAAGQITSEEALLLRFQYGFAPTELPTRYQVATFSPLACATELIAEYYTQRTRLTNDTIDRIDGWLRLSADKIQYLSPSGHFELSYSLSGPNAVPALDVSPANGIPDYVERVALYCDRSWAVEVDSLGFTAPPGATYAVSFESMQYYGYTTAVNVLAGVTRIVLHNTYCSFPANDDPEGNEAGAAKVTVAHELKHATEYPTSGWSEGGWNELDATWMEDVVYDQVNDYYNYLNGESPVRQPGIPLDGGTKTTGSYEDCVWQIFLSEKWSVAVVQDFWSRRGLFPLESVMETYRAVLNSRGVSLAEAWAEFTAWNYGVGARTVPGLGYEEGAAYPEGPVVNTATMYPFATTGSVEHLAAEFVRVEGFSESDAQLLRLVLDGPAGAGPLTLAVHVTRRDGSGLIETIALGADNNADHLLSVPVWEIESAAVVVGNAATFGVAVDWDLSLSLVPIPAQPVATVDQTGIVASLVVGKQESALVRLTNTGESGSLLVYTAQVWTTDPDSGLVAAGGNKSVAGSTFTCGSTSYLPGELVNLNFTVVNHSTDEEWLTDLSLDFPDGVMVLVASDFVGGSLGDLVGDNSLGDGARVSWHGVYGIQEYGVVRDGESATGTVQVMTQADFTGDLEIGWVLTGDNFGVTPHQLVGAITLSEGNSVLTLTAPNGGEIFAVGETIPVTWSTGGVGSLVDLDFSRDGGQTWTTVASAVPNDGACDLALAGWPTNAGLLRVGTVTGEITDASDGTFQVYETPSWVGVTPESGLLAEGEFVDLRLDLTTGGLAFGDHRSWLVLANNGPGARVVVPVSLTVTSGTSAAAGGPIFAVRGAYPNPFNPRTAISFALPTATMTTVDVLDVRGRLVRRLLQGSLCAGEHQQIWDGRNDRGQGVSAGVYLVRVRAGGHSGTTKILLAK